MSSSFYDSEFLSKFIYREHHIMKKTIALIFIFLSAQLCLAGSYPAGFESLMIKNYASARGMGEAYTAVEGTSGSLFYNPAGLAFISTVNIGLNHYSGLFSAKTEELSFTYPLSAETGVIGLGLNYFYIPSDDIYDDNGDLLFEAQNHDLLIIGSFGRMFGRDLSAGISIKGGFQKAVNENVSFFAFDAGGLYQLTRDFQIGLSLNDIGSFPQSATGESSSPTRVSAGVSHRFLDRDLLAAVDFSYYFYGQTVENIGLEYKLLNLLFLRTGYKLGVDTGGLSIGAGILYNIKSIGSDLRINYAFNLNSENSTFGQIHNINLEMSLPGLSSSEKKETTIEPVKTEKNEVLISIARFKNQEQNTKADYLKEEIPEKIIDIIEDKDESIIIYDIMDKDEKMSLDVLKKAGVRFVGGGGFTVNKEMLEVTYFLVDIKTAKKVYADSIKSQINARMMNLMYDEISHKLMDKIFELKDK